MKSRNSLRRPLHAHLAGLFLIAGSLPVDAQTPAPALAPAGTPPAAAAGFDVDTLEISAPEIAELLGYQFSGYTWHFSVPTYARVKIWETGGGEVPEHPEETDAEPEIYALDGPQSEISVRIITQKTEKKPPEGQEERGGGISLAYHLSLSGRKSGQGVSDLKEASLDSAVAALMPKALAEKANYTQRVSFSTLQGLSQRPGQDESTLWLHSSGDFGSAFDTVITQMGALAEPGALARVAELRAKWQAESEARMLEKPVRIYYYRCDVHAKHREGDEPGKPGKVRDRGVYVVSLECSRAPFRDAKEDGDGDTGKPAAPSAPLPPPAAAEAPASAPTPSSPVPVPPVP